MFGDRTLAAEGHSLGGRCTRIARRRLGSGCRPTTPGRVKVEPDLTAPGHPEIFVIGDTATIDAWHGKPVPGIAPAAKQQGVHVAAHDQRRASRATTAPRPFRYRHAGNLATIGKRAAVIDFGMDQDARLARLVDLGTRPHLLPDRRAQSSGGRAQLAMDLSTGSRSACLITQGEHRPKRS